MNQPSDPIDEASRLIALYRTNLLDSEPEERFDRITRLAAQVFSVKICLVSLVDKDRQWFKSKVGLEAQETTRELSFCSHAIQERDIFVVNDASKDYRFASSSLVTMDPRVRFYAGAPLRDIEGAVLGTLCLIDSTPREFSEEQRKVLRGFADMVESEIIRADEAKIEHRLTSSLTRISSILSTLPDMVFVIERKLRFLLCNDHTDLPVSRRQLLGRSIAEALPDPLANGLITSVNRAFTASPQITVQSHTIFDSDSDTTFEMRCKKIDEKEVLVVLRDTTEQTKVTAENERLSEVAKQTTNGVVITDDRGYTVWINKAFSEISGYSAAEMTGKRPGYLLQGPDTDSYTVGIMKDALINCESFDVDIINYSKAGAAYWIRISSNPMWDSDGNLKGFIAIQTDVTKEKRDEEYIRRSDDLLRAVIDANSIGTWQFNIQTGQLQINNKWAALIGYELHELEPTNRTTWERLAHPDDLVFCLGQLEKHANGLAPVYEANMRMKHKNGDWVWINTRGRITTWTGDGKPQWLLGTHFDISAQINAETTLEQTSTQMRAVVEHMLDGVISIDEKGAMLTFNHAAEQIFGYDRDDVLGRNISLLLPSSHPTAGDEHPLGYLKTGEGEMTGRVHELEGIHRNGHVFPMELGVVELSDAGNIRFISIVRDITDRLQREQEINRLAFYDELTGLPNRRLLIDRLQQVLENCDRHNHYGALLFLDLDKFKDLNDSAGHTTGDLLLSRVGQKLTHSIRQSDTVARLGGDEFLILIASLSAEEGEAAIQAEEVAKKIFTELSLSIDLNGLNYNCSVSIGITLFNDKSLRSVDLLKQADMAMYESKAAGRKSISFYNPQMQVVVDRRIEIEQDLHEALSEEQFQLFYQKQVDHDGKMLGAEVLLRWNHPENGRVSPAEFIPAAEETGLIVPIGEWVLRQACRTLAQWSTDPTKAELILAVNISVVQFGKSDIVKTVLDALEITGANPHNLKLEITESLLASNIPDIQSKMRELQQHGVSFSIDDFGTGYSSLSYLKQLPIDQLKIDQGFVRDIITDPNDRAIAQSVITLAESMSLNVIAEGVETEAQKEMLYEMGCNTYQGYLFSKPCEINGLIFD
ncbi:bifunctional diguanylate cyclase/phosphodiesterase [Marinobacter changyiensis]|uniref:bifunctional diguanylate cyclase/phosphodiesterase n=1 Tax=Marinobacter changyiensis TaxID=2604091 RepID=UPI001264AC56|nr:EAL domain-containing protein [Marinobacter changyiensis]